MGREIAKHRDYSEQTAQKIDEEVRKIVENAEKKATELLSKNLEKLHRLAKALLEKEILGGDQIDAILKGEGEKPQKLEVEKKGSKDQK